MYVSNCKNTDSIIIEYLNVHELILIGQINKKYFQLVTNELYDHHNYNTLKQIIYESINKKIISDVRSGKFNIVQCIYRYFCFPTELDVRLQGRSNFAKLKSNVEWYNDCDVFLNLLLKDQIAASSIYQHIIDNVMDSCKRTIHLPYLCKYNIQCFMCARNQYDDLKKINWICYRCKLVHAFFAIYQNDLLMLKYLLHLKIYKPYKMCTYVITENNNIMLDCAQKNFNEGFEQCDILEFACSQGDSHIDIVQYLITHRICNLSEYSERYRPLLYAIKSNSIRLIEYLIQNGAEINGFSYSSKEFQPIYFACTHSSLLTLKCLIQYIRIPSDLLLYSIARSQSKLEVIQFLLRQRHIFNLITTDGYETLLSLAITSVATTTRFHQLQLFHVLSNELHANEYNINFKNLQGQNILLYALRNDVIVHKIDLLTIKFLIHLGIDINIIDNYHWTPLAAAIKSKRLSIVQCLIDHGVRVNYRYIEHDLLFSSFKIRSYIQQKRQKHMKQTSILDYLIKL